MANQKKGSEIAAVLSSIDPDVYVAAAYTGDYCDMSKFSRLLAIFQMGTLGTSATVDCILVQATASAGTGVKAIANCVAAQLTEAGTDSDKQALINCSAADLDVEGGFTWVAPKMTVAVATSDAGAVVLGFYPDDGPANDNDLASVDEIVN